jgi:hypothetical protein
MLMMRNIGIVIQFSPVQFEVSQKTGLTNSRKAVYMDPNDIDI